MFPPQRYKLITLSKFSSNVIKILKLNKARLSVEMTDDSESQYQEQAVARKPSKGIQYEDAEGVAGLVTQIDIDFGKGVEVLYLILKAIEDGDTDIQALLTEAHKAYYPKKKAKK